MKVKTFMAQLGMEALEQMDEHINAWVAKNGVTVKHSTIAFGHEKHRQASVDTPMVITQIWYE